MSDVGAPFEAEFRLVGGEEDVLRLGRTLETVLQRAFASSGETFSKEMTKAVRGMFGPSGGTSGFAGATRQAGALNREMLKVADLAELMQRRFQGLRNNAPDAFDTSAIVGMDRALETLLRQTNLTADEIARLGPEFRRSMAAVSENASRAFFGDQSVQQNLTRIMRTESNERIQAAQNETRLAIAASKERIVQAQQEGSRVLAETRAAGARRVALIQGFSRQLVQAENAVAAGFRGTASVLRSLAGGIGSSLAGAAGLFRRHGSDIETAMRDTARGVEFQSTRINRELTQNFSTSLESRESKILRSFRTQEQIVNNSVTRQITSLQRLETRLESGVLGAATGRSAAAGALGFGGLGALAGGAGLAGLLTSGFQRFGELERLNKQFIALTGNAGTAAALMEQVKAFAVTTPFDLLGVADLAKGFLAIGTAAEDVLPQVKTIADAVALTGGGTDELTRIQRAIGQVVSAGRLQGDELNQLAENLPGLNIRKILADQLTGGDVQALVKMQEAGELTADKFIGGLMAGLSGDPRLAGASEALGSTLTGRFANLKESFSDFGASIIGLVAGPMTFAFKQLGGAMATASNFIKGEGLSAGLDAIRTAAGGAAVAIGSLVVAKAAAEALQILGSVVGRLLTPMGLLVGVVGIVGGAIAVLAKESPAFAEALRNTLGIMRAGLEVVGDVLGGVAKGIGDALGISISSIGEFGDFLAEKLQAVNDVLFRFVGQKLRPILEGIVDFISGTLVPIVASGVRTVVSFIGDEVIPRVGDFIGFVRGTAIPAVVSAFGTAFDFAREAMGKFVDFIQTSVVPAVVDVAGALADFSLKALDFVARFDEIFAAVGGGLAGFAVGGPIGAAIGAGLGLIISNFEDVIPAVQPAIDAVTGFFETVQKFGIGKAFVDLRDGLTKTIGNVASGVQDVFSRVLDGVQRAIRNTVEAIKRFIDRVDWGKVAGGVLNFVEETGRIVGRIATHPRFVGAIALIVGAIAGAGALAAIRFGEGLIRGIASNLDDWMRIAFSGLGDALKAVFRFALEDLGRSLLLFFGALFAVTTLRTIWSDYGKNARNSFVSGFTGALHGAGGSLPGFGTTTGGFLSTLFGGNAAIQRGLRQDAENLKKLSIAEIDRMRATLGTVGRDPISIANIQLLNPKDLADTRVKVQQEFDKLVKQIGPGGVAAIQLRNAAVGIGDSFKFALGRDVEGGIRARFSALNAAITEGGRTLVANAGAIGRAMAGALAAGLAGFQIGRAAGQSGGLLELLLGIGSGAAIGFSVGGGPGAAVGASLAAIGAAVGRTGEAAKKATDEIREYSDALDGIGKSDRLDTILKLVNENLKDESTETLTVLSELGFRTSDFADKLQEGAGAVRDYIADIIEGFGPTSAKLADHVRSGEVSLGKLSKILSHTTGEWARVQDEVEQAGIDYGDFGNALDFVIDESGELRLGIQRVNLEMALNSDRAREGRGWMGAWGREIGSVRVPIEAATSATQAFVDIISQANSLDTTPFPGRSILSSDEQKANDLAFVNEINGILKDTELGLQRAERAADDARNALVEYLTYDPGDESVVSLINDFATELPDVQANLVGALTSDMAPLLRDATLAEINEAFLQDFKADIAVLLEKPDVQITDIQQFITDTKATIQTALDQGVIDADTAARLNMLVASVETDPTFQTKIAEFFDTLNPLNMKVGINVRPALTVEPLTDQQIRDIVKQARINARTSPTHGGPVAAFASGAGGEDAVSLDVPFVLNPVFSAGGPREVGADVVRQIAAGITGATGLVVVALRNVLDVTARVGAPVNTFYGTGATVGKAFAAGLGASAQAAASSVYSVVNAALRTAGSSYNAWYGVGQNIGKALAAGISSTINAIAQAAYNAVQAAINAARTAAKVKSPSRVFMDIGANLGEGLAIGMANASSTVAGAAMAMVGNATSVAEDAANAIKVLPTATSANVDQIIEASGGTTTVNVSLSVDGNIYGDKALEDTFVSLMNQVGQAVGTRPRVTVGFGNG